MVIVALALLGPLLAGDPLQQHDLARGALQPPTLSHWLGTDQHARDVFARLAHGARLSLVVAAIAVTVSTTLGLAIGLAAGTLPGVAGLVVSRLIDLALALPRVVVLLLVVAAVGVLPAPLLGLALGATGWPGVARLVRGEAQRLREQEFVTAARALGASPARVVRREILPGTLPVAFVAAALGVGDVLLLEAGLSFLGLGIRPPTPTWGGMILTTAATLLGEALCRRLGLDAR
jgi:peptide/nickel transport system permease protein